MTVASEVLFAWNALEPEAAATEILPCCGSIRWANELVQTRPVGDEMELFECSDAIWRALSPADWDEAFRSHPKIGESKAETTTPQSAAWSRDEQEGLATSGVDIRSAIREANRTYELRFGRIYIVCAAGRSAEEMLADLERRLQNDAERELLEAVEQQRQITQLRLRKWLKL